MVPKGVGVIMESSAWNAQRFPDCAEIDPEDTTSFYL